MFPNRSVGKGRSPDVAVMDLKNEAMEKNFVAPKIGHSLSLIRISYSTVGAVTGIGSCPLPFSKRLLQMRIYAMEVEP